MRAVKIRKGKKPSRGVFYGALEHKLHLEICPTLRQRNWAFIVHTSHLLAMARGERNLKPKTPGISN